jgi:anti-sigma factor RsiW
MTMKQSSKARSAGDGLPCLHVDILALYATGQVIDPRPVEDHLAGCAECREKVADAEAMKAHAAQLAERDLF